MHLSSIRPLVMACALLACAPTMEKVAEIGHDLHPYATGPAVVVSAQAHGPYLAAALRSERLEMSFLAPASDTCTEVLAPEARVTYAKHGHFGRALGEAGACDLVGVASLAAWRDRRARALGPGFPRERASFREIHRDESTILVRGRFPLASRIGVPRGFDLVAMLPASEACEVVVARGETSLEFRDSGPEPFRLLGDVAACPILGFALPLDAIGRQSAAR
jgi:hypothetical protein